MMAKAVERILVFGPWDAGKTYQLLRIAQWLQPTGAQFYCLDNDDAYDRCLDEFPDIENLHVTGSIDWQGHMDWIEDIGKKVVPNRDWVVIDKIDKPWPFVQEHVAEMVYSKSMAELMQGRRSEGKHKASTSDMLVPSLGQADWQIVNSFWKRWLWNVLYKTRANIYLACSDRSVRKEDDKRLQEIFGPIGSRPSGQADVPFEMHSVLYFGYDRGKRYWTTVKDRGGRRRADKEALVSFPQQYLQAIAGWSRNGH